MGRTRQWANASTAEARRDLRAEMMAKYNALKPDHGMINRPCGSVAELAAKYGLTTCQFVNIVNWPRYRNASRKKAS